MANVLTNLGEEWVVDRLIGTSGTYSSSTGAYVGWGTGAGTSNKTDTALFTQSNDPSSTAMVSTNAVAVEDRHGHDGEVAERGDAAVHLVADHHERGLLVGSERIDGDAVHQGRLHRYPAGLGRLASSSPSPWTPAD